MNAIDQKKRLHFLDHAYEISQDYKDWRRIYLEINIGFTSFFSLALTFIINTLVLNEIAKSVLYIGFILLLLLTSYNILFNLKEHATKGTVKTWYHYRHHFNDIKEKGKDITYQNFTDYCKALESNSKAQLEDDWRSLFNLFKTQDNYFKLLKKTRKYTLYSLIEFLISLIVSFSIFIVPNFINLFQFSLFNLLSG